MRTGLLPFILLLSAFQGFSQSSDVTILENNPNLDYTILGGGIGIINLSENNGLTFPIFATNTFIRKKFSFTANAKLNLRFNPSSPFAIESVYKPTFPRDVSALFTYNFLDIEKQGKILVTISCGRRICRGIKVPAVVNYRLGLDLGIQTGSVWHNLKFIHFTGTGYDGTVYKIGNSISNGDNFVHTDRSTFYDYALIKAGISLNSVDRLKIYYEGVQRETNSSKRWYFNLLYAPYILIDDVFVEVQTTETFNEVYNEDLFRRLELQATMELRRFGWALGIHAVNLETLGLDYTIEVGAIPGPQSKLIDSFYLNTTFAVGFGWLKERTPPKLAQIKI